MDLSALLPVWIIGAPLVVALVIRFMAPSADRVGTARPVVAGSGTTTAGLR